MLDPFDPEIWINDGPVVDGMAGFHYPTRMAVIRLSAGDLIVWSPTALTAPLRQAVEALGPVRHIIAPNSLHHMALPDWHTAFPGALVHAMPGVAENTPCPVSRKSGPRCALPRIWATVRTWPGPERSTR